MQHTNIVELVHSDEFRNADEEAKIKLLTFYMKSVRRTAYDECEEMAIKIASYPRMGPKTAGAQAVAHEINRVKRYVT